MSNQTPQEFLREHDLGNIADFLDVAHVLDTVEIDGRVLDLRPFLSLDIDPPHQGLLSIITVAMRELKESNKPIPYEVLRLLDRVYAEKLPKIYTSPEYKSLAKQ